MLRQAKRFVVEGARYAIDTTMLISAPPGATGLRWPLQLRAAVGGVLGRLYHRLGLRFEYTPLLALPLALAGAACHAVGALWAGVICSFLVASADVADGVAQGYAVDPLPAARRPRRRMALRKRLDSFVVDPSCRVLLYGVFGLRLYQEGLVPPALLGLLLLLDLSANLLTSRATVRDRSGELFYEFVLDEAGAARFRPFYRLRVLVGHLAAYHGYATVMPLLGYLAPLSVIGVPAFWAVFAIRGTVFATRLVGFTAAEGRRLALWWSRRARAGALHTRWLPGDERGGL